MIPPSSNSLYKSGLILHQQERNSPTYQSYKQKNHDYVNTEYMLHTGSLATRGQTAKSLPMPGLVSKRSAAFEAFVQGTLTPTSLQNGHHKLNGHQSPSQFQQGNVNSSSAFQQIRQKPMLGQKTSSPFQQRSNSATLPFPRGHGGSPHLHNPGGHQTLHKQPPVQVILSNANSGSSYKSQIENKVKLLSSAQANPNQTYVSNMHVRVPSQESSIYSDTRTYINLGQPVAIAGSAEDFPCFNC